MLAFAFLVTLFVGPVQMGTQILTDAQNAIAGWRRVIGILDTPADLVDPGPDGEVLPRGPIDVTFDDVTFAYPGGPPVLRDVTMHIDAGTRIAIVGETGSGKSTFAKLLTRLMDPSEGQVLLDGDRRPRHRHGVAAPQRGAGAAGGLPLRRHPRRQRALRQARRHRGRHPRQRRRARPRRLGGRAAARARAPGSGQRGESLSAGERQLVALLRAHLVDPDLLVLDEATSAVDPALEMRIGRALERLMSGRTSVTIAHRLSTAENADEVVVVDHGRIVQRGPHPSWSPRPGVYAGLHASVGWRTSRRALDPSRMCARDGAGSSAHMTRDPSIPREADR